jgi:hypothetical protein
MRLARQKRGKMKDLAANGFVAVRVSAREYDTIIAALRMWQSDVTDEMTDDEGIPADFAEIALEHGNALTSEEIDALIERVQS